MFRRRIVSRQIGIEKTMMISNVIRFVVAVLSASLISNSCSAENIVSTIAGIPGDRRVAGGNKRSIHTRDADADCSDYLCPVV